MPSGPGAGQGSRGGLQTLVPVPAAVALDGSSCSGNRALVSSGSEELWADTPPPPGPLGALREGLRALLMALLHCAQIHKGYLDDPRNTDNAWVETVAVSVHFDSQNDVEMKRLNSVRPLTSAAPLPALGGHGSQISRPTSPSAGVHFSSCVQWRKNRGVNTGSLPPGPQKERAGGWGLKCC